MSDMPNPGSYETCYSVGGLNSVTGIIGSYETSETSKIFIGADEEISKEYLPIDVRDNSTDYLEIEKHMDCPICVHGKYELLNTPMGSYSTSSCGHDAWQVIPAGEHRIDLNDMDEKLKNAGDVKVTKFTLNFKNGLIEFKLFPDGRVIVANVKDEITAKNIRKIHRNIVL